MENWLQRVVSLQSVLYNFKTTTGITLSLQEESEDYGSGCFYCHSYFTCWISLLLNQKQAKKIQANTVITQYTLIKFNPSRIINHATMLFTTKIFHSSWTIL